MDAQRHNVLIVGTGSIGERHLRCFLATGRAQVAFVEVKPELREQVAQRYPAAGAFASIEQAMGAARFDAAVIATPAPLHVPQATELAGRGVHLLIEKPLSVSTNGVEDLSKTAQQHRAVIAMAYVYRAHPALAQMRAAIASGRFGRPVQLVAVSGQHFPHYRPAYRDTYYTRHASGGGAVQDALTHIVNAGEWLVGPISHLAADASHQVLAGVDVEDTAHVIARHGDVMGSYALNQHQAPNETTITVVCAGGTARLEMHRGRWMWCEQPEDPWHEQPCETLERDALFMRQANAFLDSIDGAGAPLCTLAEGVQTLKVNLAILKSSQERRWESLS